MTLVVLPLVWLAVFALAAASSTGHPYRALATPFVATAVWLAVLLG